MFRALQFEEIGSGQVLDIDSSVLSSFRATEQVAISLDKLSL